jgi:hypothetical protein
VLKKRSTNLMSPTQPATTDWTSAETPANLHQLYVWAQGVATAAIDWYMIEKEGKARWSRGLRATAAVLAASGGAVPIAALSAGHPALGASFSSRWLPAA